MLNYTFPALRGGILLYLIITLLCLISACATEQNYRGVPETTWNQLSGEQKQLIVDRSFQDEMKLT